MLLGLESALDSDGGSGKDKMSLGKCEAIESWVERVQHGSLILSASQGMNTDVGSPSACSTRRWRKGQGPTSVAVPQLCSILACDRSREASVFFSHLQDVPGQVHPCL